MRTLDSTDIRDFVTKPSFDEEVLLGRDDSWPRISIVTPSFNQAQFVERTILSVLNQNYPNLEYVVMDGGSTDGSVEIIQRYAPYLFRWVSAKDGGQSDAVRQGLGQCTGRIFAYLNSDDVYLPGTLFSVARAVRVDSRADVFYGNLYHIDKEDQIIAEHRLTPYIPFFSRLGMLYGGFGIYQPPTFWTRDVYDRVGGIDPNFVHCMDVDLFVRFSQARARFAFIHTPLAAARKHAEAKTSTLQHVAEKETRFIQHKYGRHRITLPIRACTSLTKTARVLLYAAQGDTAYLCKKTLMRSSTSRSG